MPILKYRSEEYDLPDRFYSWVVNDVLPCRATDNAKSLAERQDKLVGLLRAINVAESGTFWFYCGMAMASFENQNIDILMGWLSVIAKGCKK